MGKMRNEIYEIEVLKWEDNLAGLKKNHAYFPVLKRLFDHHRVATLTPLERLLYVILLGRCADEYSAVIRPTRNQLTTSIGSSRYDVVTALRSLERNQLVRLLKPLPERIGKERKREERKGISDGVEDRPAPVVIEPTPMVTKANADRGANKRVWEAYREAYFARYQVEPIRNAKVNSNIAQFTARVGADEAPEIAAFFVRHNDSFYVKSMHAFGLCLRDAEALRTQWLKGRAITQADVRRFERNQEHASIIDAIDREGV